jgi:membrane protease YdiL (CAAX protease family)
MSHALAVAWAIAAAVLLHAVVYVTVQLRPGSLTDVVNRGAAEALVFVAVTFAVLQLHAPHLSGRRALGLRPTHPGLPVLGLALGLVVHLPAESIREVVERYYPTPTDVLSARAAMLSGRTPLDVVLVLLSVACVGPLVEEIFFRGGLFGALRRHHSVTSASVTTAIAFVVGHFDPRLWPSLVIVAVVLAYLRAASGSLLPCLALHVAFNTVTVLAFVTGVSSVTTPTKLPLGMVLAGWGATAGLVVWAQRLARSPEAAVARAEDDD